MKIVIATSNQNKLGELKELLKNFDVQILSLQDFPDIPDIIEDGKTFEENALKKARTVCRHTGLIAIADDSGLEVDYLKGQPGVFSARYSGSDSNDKRNYKKLLGELKTIPHAERGARFRCVLSIAHPSDREQVVTGECRGFITTEPRGVNGFGYDPVFLDPVSGLTFAEMGPAQKNKISHRARALHELLKILPGFLGMGSQ
jgi:XTP/dITP diphosphohydrolase